MPENRGKGSGLPHNEATKTVGNDESKRWRGGPSTQQKLDERANTAYCYILEGGTRRQIAEKLKAKFNTSLRTSHDDYTRGMKLLQQEQQETRSDLLNQLQALRLAGARKALAKGHYQTFAMLLKDMGAVIGEAAPETLAISAPELKVTIEDNKKAP